MLDCSSCDPQAKEIEQLIACQTSALKAVRLQTLIPPKTTWIHKDQKDLLDKTEVSNFSFTLLEISSVRSF